MDGVAIIRALLVSDGALTALVPEVRIIAGVLPAGTPLDAIAITSVSSVDRNVLTPGETRHVADRVQITGFGATYPRLKALMRAAKKACADYIGDIAGLTDVTVHTYEAGPDFTDEKASLQMGTRDFMVEYTEIR